MLIDIWWTLELCPEFMALIRNRNDSVRKTAAYNFALRNRKALVAIFYTGLIPLLVVEYSVEYRYRYYLIFKFLIFCPKLKSTV